MVMVVVVFMSVPVIVIVIMVMVMFATEDVTKTVIVRERAMTSVTNLETADADERVEEVPGIPRVRGRFLGRASLLRRLVLGFLAAVLVLATVLVRGVLLGPALDLVSLAGRRDGLRQAGSGDDGLAILPVLALADSVSRAAGDGDGSGGGMCTGVRAAAGWDNVGVGRREERRAGRQGTERCEDDKS